MKPNIVLVVLDTARADAFEPYGAPAGSSPTVAQLAAAGTAHPATFSTACWTAPSHGSMFTGLLPRSAGLGHVGGATPQGFRHVLEGAADRLLPQVLRANGYETMGVSTNLWVSPNSGFDVGFDRFRYVKGMRHEVMHREDLRSRAEWMLQSVRARADDGAGAVRSVLDDWVRANPSKPFFLFVNLIECHSPYLPPRPFTPLGPIERARAALEAHRHLTFGEIWKSCVGGFDIPDGAIDRMKRGYAGAIRLLDDWLARLLDLLDRAGVLADTEIVVTSDHGENLGEDRLIGHAFSLDDRLIRLPFVASGPVELPEAPLLSIADVPRLAAAIAGIDDHPWGELRPDDIPVAQFDAPAAPGHPRIQEALDLWGLGADAARRLVTSFSCATDGEVKLVRRLGHDELFDLGADPMEQAPRALDPDTERRYADRLPRLRAALDRAEREEQSQPGPSGGVTAEDVGELEAQMRLLGYL